MFKSGFVNIIGNPNVGKSTLLNALLGENLSITTYKPQTTRHRIQGILTTDAYQIVFSDTPGFIAETAYKLHEKMNSYVHTAFEDADVILLVTTPNEQYAQDHHLIRKLRAVEVPIFLVLNKIDTASEEEVLKALSAWQAILDFSEFVPISALKERGTVQLLSLIIQHLKEGPAYYPDDQISNRDLRFFVSEIIREQIYLQFREEIPYSAEVVIESFEESKKITHINAVILVNRKSQKTILIGKGGQAIKSIGIESRKRIQEFLETKVHLELFVKVRENWRNNDLHLNQLGYRK